MEKLLPHFKGEASHYWPEVSVPSAAWQQHWYKCNNEQFALILVHIFQTLRNAYILTTFSIKWMCYNKGRPEKDSALELAGTQLRSIKKMIEQRGKVSSRNPCTGAESERSPCSSPEALALCCRGADVTACCFPKSHTIPDYRWTHHSNARVLLIRQKTCFPTVLPSVFDLDRYEVIDQRVIKTIKRTKRS